MGNIGFEHGAAVVRRGSMAATAVCVALLWGLSAACEKKRVQVPAPSATAATGATGSARDLASSPLATRRVGADPDLRSGRAVLRLVEHLDDATVSSKLDSIGTATTLADAWGKVARQEVFSEAFEDPAAPRLAPAAGACVGIEGSVAGAGSGVWHYRGAKAHECVFVLPAKPSTHYRIARRIRTSDPHVDLQAYETRVSLRYPSVTNHAQDLQRVLSGRLVKMRDLLMLHRFEPAKGAMASGWHRDEIHIFTTPFTRSLVLMVQDAENALTPGRNAAFFDDIVVERLSPSAEQELALLKGADLAEGASAALGMGKHGQLLPLGDTETVSPPLDSNFDHRSAIFAPAPTRLEWTVAVGSKADLTLAAAPHRASKPGDVISFSVAIGTGTAPPQVVWKTRVRADGEGSDWYWHEARIPLSAHAGKTIRLRLETSAPEGSRGYGLWGSPMIVTPRHTADPPNVLFIGADTLRADRLSVYGHVRDTAPNLARMAREGVLFSRAISPSNWTSPAFASLFTGLLPSQHGVVHRARTIVPSVTTLAEHFSRRGWVTQGFAFKAYLYNMGFEQGFDRWFNVPRLDSVAGDVVDRALAWLESHGHERFFLFLHFNDPHQPFNQPQPYDTRFVRPEKLRQLGATLPMVIDPIKGPLKGCKHCTRGRALKPEFKTAARALYDGELAYLDAQVGRLLQSLRERGLYENTIIAFVADHGEMMWEFGDYFGHGGTYLQDELIHVPLIIKPARGDHSRGLAVGRTVAETVAAHDLMPTLMEMVGMETEAKGIGSSSTSLLSAMRGEGSGDSMSANGERIVVTENVKHRMVAIEQSGYKHVSTFRLDRPFRESLFDVRVRRGEERDVSGLQGERLRALRLRAVEHVLGHQAGRYILVRSGEAVRGNYRIHVRGATPNEVVPQWGVSATQVVRRRGKAARFMCDAPGPGPLVAVFAVKPGIGAGVSLQVHVRSDGSSETRFDLGEATAQPYRPGMLSPAEKHAVDVVVVEGVGAEALGEDVHVASENAQRINALRALGYVQ